MSTDATKHRQQPDLTANNNIKLKNLADLNSKRCSSVDSEREEKVCTM